MVQSIPEPVNNSYPAKLLIYISLCARLWSGCSELAQACRPNQAQNLLLPPISLTLTLTLIFSIYWSFLV